MLYRRKLRILFCIVTEKELLQAYAKTAESELTIMIETVDGLRFCLEYDAEGGWIRCSQTTRCYRVTEEMAGWFSHFIFFLETE